MNKLRRIYNKFYAHFFGYFWIPCSICKEYFGGHELHEVLHTSWNSGNCVCINCKEEAIKRNKQFFKNNLPPTIMIHQDKKIKKFNFT